MQIYSFEINGEIYRLYGKIIGKHEQENIKCILYEDYKKRKWLYISQINDKQALLSWKTCECADNYLNFLFTEHPDMI